MIALLSFAALGYPALATDSPPEGGKKVCRAAAAPIGSHMKRPRLCKTEAEWKAIEDARRAATITTKAPQAEPWERTRAQ